jgi:maltodextrin utilization protein YvdJ
MKIILLEDEVFNEFKKLIESTDEEMVDVLENALAEYRPPKGNLTDPRSIRREQESVCMNPEACKEMKEELDNLKKFKESCISLKDVAKEGINAIKYRFEHPSELSGGDFLEMAEALDMLYQIR